MNNRISLTGKSFRTKLEVGKKKQFLSHLGAKISSIDKKHRADFIS